MGIKLAGGWASLQTSKKNLGIRIGAAMAGSRGAPVGMGSAPLLGSEYPSSEGIRTRLAGCGAQTTRDRRGSSLLCVSPTSASEMATWWDSMVGLRQVRGEMWLAGPVA